MSAIFPALIFTSTILLKSRKKRGLGVVLQQIRQVESSSGISADYMNAHLGSICNIGKICLQKAIQESFGGAQGEAWVLQVQPYVDVAHKQL